MEIDNEFDFGDEVYLVTDPDQSLRIVTTMSIMPKRLIMYELSKSEQASWHFDFEISRDKNLSML